MASFQNLTQISRLVLGQRVEKTAAFTQNAGTDLFKVEGGLVAVTAIVGVVTTAVANTASLTAKLQHTPTAGSASDLCGATGITNDGVGTIYSLVSGLATDLLSIQSISEFNDSTPHPAAETPGVTFAQLLRQPIALPPGTTRVLTSNHDPGSGTCRWIMTYVPLDLGASVAAA